MQMKVNEPTEPNRCDNCTRFYVTGGECYENPNIQPNTPSFRYFREIVHNADPITEEFTKALWDASREIAGMVMSKDKKYKSAYRKLRIICKEKYGDPTIPYFIHSQEKQLRQDAEDDDEDPMLDSAGYSLLELVCKRLDDV